VRANSLTMARIIFCSSVNSKDMDSPFPAQGV
jgi:hypothetical protein